MCHGCNSKKKRPICETPSFAPRYRERTLRENTNRHNNSWSIFHFSPLNGYIADQSTVAWYMMKIIWYHFLLQRCEGGPIGAGYPERPERELDVDGRPESKLARVSCLGVVSPGVAPKGNLVSKRGGQPPTELSSSGKLTPLSFQGLR